MSNSHLLLDEHQERALDHFIRLARRGKHPAASGGEHRCKALADVVIDNAGGNDDLAMDGLIVFLMIARADHSAAWNLIRGDG